MTLTNSASILLMATIASLSVAEVSSKKNEGVKEEKCYGVVKAGHNNCYANAHTCAGEATIDADAYEWILLPKGLCERLNGGTLVAGNKEYDKYAEKIAARKLRQAERLRQKELKTPTLDD
jgi:uncharacterized membrane protein